MRNYNKEDPAEGIEVETRIGASRVGKRRIGGRRRRIENQGIRNGARTRESGTGIGIENQGIGNGADLFGADLF